MRVTSFRTLLAVAALSAAAFGARPAAAAIIVFDDFNVNEGHFASAPTTSGSNLNIAATSTAVRDATVGGSKEGAGFERLVVNPTTAGGSTRLRFLSGVGTPANNTAFVTTAIGVDGFIGFYLKTTSPGWTAQLALDGPLPDLQGGVPKNVINDGAWHLYEWNLDLNSDWGAVASIGGNTTFEQGSQTIDSIVLRNLTAPASSTIDLDYVVKSNNGTIAALIPEPATLSLAAMGFLGMVAARRKS